MTLKQSIETIAKSSNDHIKYFVIALVENALNGKDEILTVGLTDAEKQFLTNNNYTYYFRDDISEWVIELN